MILNSSPDSWFAVTTKPSLEKVTTLALQAKGLEAFLPVYAVRRQWCDRIKTLEVPLFPGYTFCRFDPARRLPVLSTPGATSIVGYGSIPVAIDDMEIDAIRIILKSGLPAQPWPFVKNGARILIEKGPLAGVEGVVTAIKNECRLVASITLLQRSVSVELDGAWVRPLSESTPAQFRPPASRYPLSPCN